MTPTEQAARWLADCPRFVHVGRLRLLREDPNGSYVHWHDAIAAIARHLAPDDLVEAVTDAADDWQECLGHVVTALGGKPDWHGAELQKIVELREAAARIAALTATVAEQDALDAAWCERVAAITAENATLRDRLARMEGALIWCSAASDFAEGGVAREGWLKLCAPLIAPDVADAELLQVIVADQVAALTDGGSNG